jgi:lactoylglutathione lyase
MAENNDPLLLKVDAIQVRVPDLDAGLAFYRDALGHEIVWRTPTAAGLRLPNSEAELVLQVERPGPEIEFKVADADEAARRWQQAGGAVVETPFDIQIGRAVVVRDPWGTEFVLLDASKGLLTTDPEGNVTGNASP